MPENTVRFEINNRDGRVWVFIGPQEGPQRFVSVLQMSREEQAAFLAAIQNGTVEIASR
jgi:hypothetical protein